MIRLFKISADLLRALSPGLTVCADLYDNICG